MKTPSAIAGTGVLLLFLAVLIPAGLRAGEIHAAAATGRLERVRTLVETDRTLLESKDENGFTPLHRACFARQVAVAEYLLDQGAGATIKDNYQFTPLHRAAYVPGQDLALLQRLIDKGADVNAQGYNGLTPLHWAARSGDLQVLRLLFENGADPNIQDKYRGGIGPASISGTVLQVAINFGLKQETAEFLVENGAKPNRKDPDGNTELHLAALKGYAGLARLLIEHGADVHQTNAYGRTALYYAARHGYRSVAKELIAAGAKKSAIVEKNYGKAPQLAAKLQRGEAYLWSMSSLEFVLKTTGHMILFNPSGIDDSPEAALANGHINPRELAGQRIIALATVSERMQYGAQAFDLAKRIPGTSLVFAVKPPAAGADTASYRLAAPHESFSLNGVRVNTIPAVGGGSGYLVETDGVKVFHAGFHVPGKKAEQQARFREEIDFLKPFGPVDLAILSVGSHHPEIEETYEPFLYLLDQLSPKAVYLTGANIPEQYTRCAEVLRGRRIPVEFPEGRARGQRFHFPAR